MYVMEVEAAELSWCYLTTRGRPVPLAWLWQLLHGWQTAQHPLLPVGEDRQE